METVALAEPCFKRFKEFRRISGISGPARDFFQLAAFFETLRSLGADGAFTLRRRDAGSGSYQ